jgi:hypothetical protein
MQREHADLLRGKVHGRVFVCRFQLYRSANKLLSRTCFLRTNRGHTLLSVVVVSQLLPEHSPGNGSIRGIWKAALGKDRLGLNQQPPVNASDEVAIRNSSTRARECSLPALTSRIARPRRPLAGGQNPVLAQESH